MNELLNKISSYNFINYLFPGVVFAIILKQLQIYNIIQEDLFIGFFVYYFIGLVISRFGSVILEPLLKKIKFVHFANYNDFVSASGNDAKIEILSEQNNTYRTILSMFTILIIIGLFKIIENKFLWLSDYNFAFLGIIFLIIFLFSYRKQVKYIKNRVDIKK